MTVRIGIDARKLHDYGIGTYIRNLLRELARLDRSTEFVLLCRPEDSGAIKALGENFRPVIELAGNYSIAEQFKVPLALQRKGARNCRPGKSIPVIGIRVKAQNQE